MTETNLLLTDLSQGVLSITLNRPPVNAFNFDLIFAAQEAFQRAARDEQVRCVMLSGAGENFSAGQDITAFDRQTDIPFRYHLLRTYNPLILQIRRLEKPVLAVVNGAVSGAALGIVLACDLRIASEKARFVVGFAGIGLAPDSGVSLLLPALVGLGRASEFTFSNEPINAEQALAWGLVNRLAPADELQAQAADWAAQLARGPLRAMGLAKRAFNRTILGHLEQALDYEAHLQEIAGRSAEHQEGVRAFMEKRLPRF
jgi:2-(1,2-epoxy-1,2-dihydrophenyl)acetyl-CoA isomerase